MPQHHSLETSVAQRNSKKFGSIVMATPKLKKLAVNCLMMNQYCYGNSCKIIVLCILIRDKCQSCLGYDLKPFMNLATGNLGKSVFYWG